MTSGAISQFAIVAVAAHKCQQRASARLADRHNRRRL